MASKFVSLMVVAVFPLVKIGLLLLKQLSKPVANLIKNEAKRHPLVRKHVIVPIGKTYQWIENAATFRMKGAKAHEPEQVSEEEAVELGANAMGEIILFGLLSLILLAEMNRQGDKKAVLEKTKAEEIVNLQDTVLELNDELHDLRKTVQEIKHTLENPPDIFDMEQQRHQQVTDHNFWDLMTTKKKKPHSRVIDKTSPSV